MDAEAKPSEIVIAQTVDDAKTAAYANHPKTGLVIFGLSENPAMTTCGWARHFFDNRPNSF
jgi:hypothetical protein